MATFTDFAATVRDYLNRSDLTDSMITAAAKQAIVELEHAFDFSYMREIIDDFTFTDGAAELPDRTKHVIGLIYDDGVRSWDLRSLPYKSLRRITKGTYARYYSVVGDMIYARPKPDDETGFTLIVSRMSDLTSATTHWLLNNAQNVLLFKVLLLMQGYLHDEARAAYWSEMYTQALDALQSNEIERITGSGYHVIVPGTTVV